MSVLNVRQPVGGVALFGTVMDEFLAFDAEPRDGAEWLPWDDALRRAIGSRMDIGPDVECAIGLGVVSLAKCQEVLRRLEADWEKR